MSVKYFDHIASNPMLPEVFDAMVPYFKEQYGNPMSMYDLGMNAKQAIDTAREQVAKLINAKPSEIIFTSSGAESNNFAIKGMALARQGDGKHLIISKAEHHSVMNTARSLEKQGFVVTYVPVDNNGMVDPDAVKKSITKETTVISIIHASSEVGTIEPIKEIAAIAKEHKIGFHTDAVATVGNIPVDVKDLGVDALSLSAHQFYGPKGAAAMYLKTGQRILPLIYGGIQEGGRRAGTENVPAIVGMGKAAELAAEDLPARMAHVRQLRDRLTEGILKIEKVHPTGHPQQRLPGLASFVVEYIEGEGMLLLLLAKGIYAASGSACTSKALKASPVLVSMGVPTSMAHGSIVFSLGIGNTTEAVDCCVEEFPQIVKRLRDMSPFAKEGWGALGAEEGGSKEGA
ncbi:cysteine desulfurase family protein [Candidatus Magnetominusculus xianensis]|uniref:Cysteine desulfurase n=1 Tax=Candidatus Magnetominusculus xianensis TaxID=1748249 RepID=A0ABR5SEG0_9BACT|nr:cysteine desulfurase family protein [Candidatus Magnetominusculus xianensis]KWT82490.1 cysteine desulfurase [Candidatus Magnetominusculus xianensis]MBF0403210.1 cysteine desulfurase [Nitrospirota bacterium]